MSRMRRLAAGIILSVLNCARIVAQGNATTAASLPLPTGPHVVGTSIAYLVDRSRPGAEFPAGRPITVQLWYPATQSNHAPAQYLAEPGLSALLPRLQYYGIDRTADAWGRLRTHSTVDSPPVKGKHPLLAFSVGLGVIRANYTSIAEELASHGYVIALVESPMQGIQVLPDGREILDSAVSMNAAVKISVKISWHSRIGFQNCRLRSRDLSCAPRIAYSLPPCSAEPSSPLPS